MPGLSADELAELTAAFTLRHVPKRTLIVQPGEVADYRVYVLRGAFRAYVVDPAGVEHTLHFAVEDWWMTDLSSYHSRLPATMYVVALEDSTVLQLDYATEQRLMQRSRRYETLFRLQAERAAAYHQRRLTSALTRTAEERYADFLATYPDVVQRLPQYIIASYLGMSKEFLSRIRSRSGAKKA
ncbi:MAG: Crp/Fnr family transcriptional regulator [Janthinobacterium lividum]